MKKNFLILGVIVLISGSVTYLYAHRTIKEGVAVEESPLISETQSTSEDLPEVATTSVNELLTGGSVFYTEDTDFTISYPTSALFLRSEEAIGPFGSFKEPDYLFKIDDVLIWVAVNASSREALASHYGTLKQSASSGTGILCNKISLQKYKNPSSCLDEKAGTHNIYATSTTFDIFVSERADKKRFEKDIFLGRKFALVLADKERYPFPPTGEDGKYSEEDAYDAVEYYKLGISSGGGDWTYRSSARRTGDGKAWFVLDGTTKYKIEECTGTSRDGNEVFMYVTFEMNVETGIVDIGKECSYGLNYPM
jgi:hypothetical protein